jgi:hypothetical protein
MSGLLMRRIAFLLALAFATAAQAAAARLTEPEVRAFVARQSKAWNAGHLATFFGLFTPEATFRDQALASDNKIYPYGTSTLAQARARSRQALKGHRVQEVTTVRSIAIAADGRSAKVAADVVTTIGGPGGPRRSCARREQVVTATAAGLRSTGETDTVVRCR